MRYIAKPVEVEAHRIAKVSGRASAPIPATQNTQTDLVCWLENGEPFRPTVGQIARMLPKAGDYVVTQADGYVYLNPKEVFERKYELNEPSVPA